MRPQPPRPLPKPFNQSLACTAGPDWVGLARISMLLRTFETRRGFSMLEMLIVLAIMGIMSTLSVSYLLAAKPHATLEQAQLELLSRLNSARQLAITEEAQTRVRFDTTVTPNQYWVQQ